MKQIMLWNPNRGIAIPPEATSARDIAQYARQLTKREVTQIVGAMDAGNYEMGALFLWQKAMTGLKGQIGSLGMDFVGELLDRQDISEGSAAVQVLTDHDAVRLAEELGMFTSTAAMRLQGVLQIITHFSESPKEEEEEEDRQMMPEEAMQCLRTCIQNILGHERLEGAVEFARFRAALEEKQFTARDVEIRNLLSSAYFFQRTVLRVLMALARTARGAQLEHVLANTNVIVPLLWNGLRKPDRWLVGRAYAEVHSEGRTTATAGLRKALLGVRGFDYVPEDLRSRSFLAVADDVINVHFAMNNFHNEPSAIRKLDALGTTIPIPALARCMTAILCIKLGNRYGVSWYAQGTADTLLERVSGQRWGYYLNECMPADSVILDKLMGSEIASRWIELVRNRELSVLESDNKNVRKLIGNGKKGIECNQVISAAKNLYRKLHNL